LKNAKTGIVGNSQESTLLSLTIAVPSPKSETVKKREKKRRYLSNQKNGRRRDRRSRFVEKCREWGRASFFLS